MFLFIGKTAEGEHEIEETTRESEGTTRESGREGMWMLGSVTIFVFIRCYGGVMRTLFGYIECCAIIVFFFSILISNHSLFFCVLNDGFFFQL